MPTQQRRVMDCCPQDFNKCPDCVRAFEDGNRTCPLCDVPYFEVPSHSPVNSGFDIGCDHWLCAECWRSRRRSRRLLCPCCGTDVSEWLLDESVYDTEEEEYDDDQKEDDEKENR